MIRLCTQCPLNCCWAAEEPQSSLKIGIGPRKGQSLVHIASPARSSHSLLRSIRSITSFGVADVVRHGGEFVHRLFQQTVRFARRRKRPFWGHHRPDCYIQTCLVAGSTLGTHWLMFSAKRAVAHGYSMHPCNPLRTPQRALWT